MTIKEVAQLAGVSSAAVSRYLNGGSLSDEKRERVRKAIEETGYHPNLMAQTMRTGRINQIGIIVPKINSDSVSQITAGIAGQLFEQNYLSMLGCTDEDDEKELRYLDIMQSNQVAGIILMGTTLTPVLEAKMHSCRLPIVVTGQNFSDFPCVYHDDFHAVKQLMKLILDRGRRHIAYIGVTECDRAAGYMRRAGAQKAFAEAGRDPEELIRITGEFNARSGYASMHTLLHEHPEIDGVLCATDTIALGAMMALKESGRIIPDDVSIAGVGDSWADAVSQPQLTTAHLFYKECGAEAARMLTHIIREGKNAGSVRQTMLEYSIIERGSV